MENPKFIRYQHVLVLMVIGWYLLLTFGHYFNQRPLWNDEKCVLDNIIQLKPVSLFTRPLLSDQEFPRLYLWTIQQFSRPFNHNLLSLRLLSFLAMMGAFFVWFKIGRRVLSDPWDLILFIGSWCASMPLVYYAAELKPYSMDVLACGVIVLFLLDQDKIRKNPHAYRVMLLFLSFLGLWSYPAVFLLLIPSYNLVRDCFDQRCWPIEWSFFLVGCMLVLGFVYLFDFRVSRGHLMGAVWHDYFIWFDSIKDFFNSFGKGMNNLISRRFAESPRWVKGPSRIFIGLGVGYMLMALGGQLKKDRFVLRSIVPISFAMFMIQLALAIVHLYPFAVPRMSLFFTPLLLLMTIMAMRFICQRSKAMGVAFRVIFAGYLIFVSLGIAWDVFIKKDLGAESILYSSRNLN